MHFINKIDNLIDYKINYIFNILLKQIYKTKQNCNRLEV